MAKKINYNVLLIVGWTLAIVFAVLAFNVENERLANIFSDSFGTAFAIVLIGSISWLYFKVKKVI